MPDQSHPTVEIRPVGPDQADIAARLMHSTHPVLYDDLYSANLAI